MEPTTADYSLSFPVSQVLVNINATTYASSSSSNNAVVASATAGSISGVQSSDIVVTGVSNDPPQRRRLALSTSTRMATAQSGTRTTTLDVATQCTVQYTVTVASIQALGYTTPDEAYTAMTQQLTDAGSSGQWDALCTSFAESMGVPSMMVVATGAVGVGNYTASETQSNNAPSGSHQGTKGVSLAVLVGASVGVAAFVIAAVVAVYLYRSWQRNSARDSLSSKSSSVGQPVDEENVKVNPILDTNAPPRRTRTSASPVPPQRSSIRRSSSSGKNFDDSRRSSLELDFASRGSASGRFSVGEDETSGGSRSPPPRGTRQSASFRAWFGFDDDESADDAASTATPPAAAAAANLRNSFFGTTATSLKEPATDMHENPIRQGQRGSLSPTRLPSRPSVDRNSSSSGSNTVRPPSPARSSPNPLSMQRRRSSFGEPSSSSSGAPVANDGLPRPSSVSPKKK